MRNVSVIAAVAASVLLAACSDTSIDSTRQWMQEQQRNAKPSVKPLPEPKKYEALQYQPAQGAEPFSQSRLTQALGAMALTGPGSAMLLREQSRRKEPLEAYPLDAMAYVGTLQKDGAPVALVKVDNLLYQVRVGNHLGQNFGRVTHIKEGQLELQEIAQDATGEWIERTSTLDLQEGSK